MPHLWILWLLNRQKYTEYLIIQCKCDMHVIFVCSLLCWAANDPPDCSETSQATGCLFSHRLIVWNLETGNPPLSFFSVSVCLNLCFNESFCLHSSPYFVQFFICSSVALSLVIFSVSINGWEITSLNDVRYLKVHQVKSKQSVKRVMRLSS